MMIVYLRSLTSTSASEVAITRQHYMIALARDASDILGVFTIGTPFPTDEVPPRRDRGSVRSSTAPPPM